MPDNAPTPTIGRRVYFWPRRSSDTNVLDHRQPFDAGVVFVHGPTRVNLLVTDHLGQTHARLNVPFGDFDREHTADEREAIDDAGGYADWMDYQKKQHGVAPAGTSLLGGATRDLNMPASAKSLTGG